MTEWASFILVDALRWDVLADPQAARRIAPNLARLAQEGQLRRAVANGQATQFVLPSLFSQTYPMDHGGYNRGLRDRPRSVFEQIQAAGYTTHFVSYANQIGFLGGFERGFDHTYTYFDYASLLKYLLERRLLYEVGLWEAGEVTTDAVTEVVRGELTRLLSELEDLEARQGLLPQPKSIRRRNRRVLRAAQAEIDLLQRDPAAVLNKIQTIPEGIYWKLLGQVRRAG